MVLLKDKKVQNTQIRFLILISKNQNRNALCCDFDESAIAVASSNSPTPSIFNEVNFHTFRRLLIHKLLFQPSRRLKRAMSFTTTMFVLLTKRMQPRMLQEQAVTWSI